MTVLDQTIDEIKAMGNRWAYGVIDHNWYDAITETLKKGLTTFDECLEAVIDTAYEAEDHARSYSPFEFTARDLNDLAMASGDYDDWPWEAFREGIDQCFTAYIKDGRDKMFSTYCELLSDEIRDRYPNWSDFDLDTFVDQYIETALWSSTDDGGHPMDDNYDRDDLADSAISECYDDCVNFLSYLYDAGDLTAIAESEYEITPDSVAHDFWLTRNGHGAGFWDRGYGQLGRQLTEAAKAFGSVYLYVGDDDKIYVQ